MPRQRGVCTIAIPFCLHRDLYRRSRRALGDAERIYPLVWRSAGLRDAGARRFLRHSVLLEADLERRAMRGMVFDLAPWLHPISDSLQTSTLFNSTHQYRVLTVVCAIERRQHLPAFR